jgi:hypothetical protein
MKGYKTIPDKWANTAWERKGTIQTFNFNPSKENRAILDAKTIGGVSKTNRVITNAQRLENSIGFKFERADKQREGRKARR